MNKYRASSFTAGVCYLIFWFSYMAVLPFTKIVTDYASVINSNGWLLVNIFQVIGIISFIRFYGAIRAIVFPGTFFSHVFDVMQYIGFFCLAGIAFAETFIWPVLADIAPDILDVNTGAVFTHKVFMFFNIGSVLLFTCGNIYFGLRLKKIFPSVGVIYAVGMTLFCLGFASGSIRYVVQTIGLTIFSAALVYMGLKKVPA